METQERPRYRLLKPFYAEGDVFVPQDQPDGTSTEIIYDGIPNPEMEPLNGAARERMKQYLESLPTPIKGLDSAISEAYENGALRRPSNAMEVVGQPGAERRKSVMGTVRESNVEVVTRAADRRFKQPGRIQGAIVVETPNGPKAAG